MLRYFFILACFILASVAALIPSSDAQTGMSVQVREGYIRVAPSHLAAIERGVSYGDRLAVFEERGDWRRVSLEAEKVQGWIHGTALTSKRIILSAGEEDVASSVTHDEIALAGKGFSEEVEDEYRRANRNLDYFWIDRMEDREISSEEILSFLEAGRLKPDREGGAP